MPKGYVIPTEAIKDPDEMAAYPREARGAMGNGKVNEKDDM